MLSTDDDEALAMLGKVVEDNVGRAPSRSVIVRSLICLARADDGAVAPCPSHYFPTTFVGKLVRGCCICGCWYALQNLCSLQSSGDPLEVLDCNGVLQHSRRFTGDVTFCVKFIESFRS